MSTQISAATNSRTTVLVPEDSGSLGTYRFDGTELCVSLAEEKDGVAGQWFYFQVVGANTTEPIRIRIENAGKSLYPRGWPDYLPVCSAHGDLWYRVPESSFIDGQLIFSIPNPPESFFIAWYEPYPLSRLTSWIDDLKDRTNARLTSPLKNFFSVSVGEPEVGSIVLIARQHPGETMPSFFVEGLVEYLTSDDKNARSLLKHFEIIMFPAMNPDGIVAGRHRYDKRGIDFNRAWNSNETPAEVQFVKDALDSASKLCFFYDIHGDEVTKKDPSYIDVEPDHGMQRTSLKAQKSILKLTTQFTTDFEVLRTSSMWLTRIRKMLFPRLYPVEKLSEGTTSTEYVSKKYGVPAFTYEIKAHGTTSEACYSMGRSLGQALSAYNRFFCRTDSSNNSPVIGNPSAVE